MKTIETTCIELPEQKGIIIAYFAGNYFLRLKEKCASNGYIITEYSKTEMRDEFGFSNIQLDFAKDILTRNFTIKASE